MDATPVNTNCRSASTRCSPLLAVLSMLLALAIAGTGAAAQDAKKGNPQNPVGAWGAPSIQQPPQPGRTFDAKQVELIGSVSKYAASS